MSESVELDQAARDLAMLQSMAAAEPALPGAEPEPEPLPAVTAEQSLAGVLQVAGMAGAVMGFPSVAAVWNVPACEGFAEKAVPVLRKHAWGARILDFLENGSGVEEIALLMYSAPLVVATVAAARADIAARVESKPEPARDQPGGKPENVEPMREVHEIGNG
jgi:hypothetical protein